MNTKIVIYQLLPRLFTNTVSHPVPNGDIESNGCGKLNDITLTLLREIKTLGATHVWFTGVIEHATQTDYSKFGIARDHSAIVKGKAGSPYAIKDYYDIDPDLAKDVPHRMDEFEALVERTHQANLKVIIDFVPNHVARQYHSDAKPMETSDLGEHDIKEHAFDPLNNFYYIPNESFAPQFDLKGEEKSPYIEFPAKATGNDFFAANPTIHDWYETVKLNYGIDYVNEHAKHFDPIPDTWHKMRAILHFWASKGIDGFRCDMAEMVPVEFWEWAIPQIKTAFPNIIFIGEIYNPLAYHLFIEKGHFDFLYDKVGMYDTLRGIIMDYETARNISITWQKTSDILPNMLYFLENHDEQRIASTFFADNPQQAIPGIIVAVTLSTAPFLLYAGQELGEKANEAEGFSGFDGRTTIFDYWRVDTIRRWYNNGACDGALLSPDEKSLRQFYQNLLHIAQTEEAIYKGQMFDLMYVNYANPHFNADKQFAFFRKATSSLLLIAVNFDALCTDLQINIPQHAFEYLQIDNNQNASSIDLLTLKQETSQLLSSNEPFKVHLPAYSGKILKISIEN
ncbi:MAG: alpha-amylase family glycosyl hydrolase [Microbacter sp.]